MDILAKKKAAPKSSKTAAKEGSLDFEDAAAGDKPEQTKARKVTKRQLKHLDSDSDSDDFGLKPSKSVAAKVCALPPVRGEGGTTGRGVGYSDRRSVVEVEPPLCHPGKGGGKGGTHVRPSERWFGLGSPSHRLTRDAGVCFMLIALRVYAWICDSLLDYAFPPEIQAGRRRQLYCGRPHSSRAPYQARTCQKACPVPGGV